LSTGCPAAEPAHREARKGHVMSSHPRRRQQPPSSRRPSQPGVVPQIPRQRSAGSAADSADSAAAAAADGRAPKLTLVPTPTPTPSPTPSPAAEQPLVLVADDAAKLVLHRETEDPDFQRAVDELPLVRMVGAYLDWVGEGVSPPPGEDAQEDLVIQLEGRLGVHFLSSSGVGRRRAQAIAIACAHLRLVTTTGDRLEPGPDREGWTDPDPVLRSWLRSRVAAAVLECSVRYLAGDHVLGDDVRHALATMVVAAGEGQPCVLGLRSATRPGDLAAEHVDRVVTEHVAELQALGLCAPGGFLAAAPGAEAVLRSVAVGLRNQPVPGPTC